MKISHKAAYHLLDRFYARRSLNELIKQDVSEDILNASILFAKDREDYMYLSVMERDRAEYDKEYAIFVGPGLDHPIILKNQEDLTLLEFAILYKNCDIHISEFLTVVEAIANNLMLNEKEEIEYFKKMAALFKEVKAEVK